MRLTQLLAAASKTPLPRDYRFGTSRPWTAAAKRRNPPGTKRNKVFVEPISQEDLKYFHGDIVSVFCGPKRYQSVRCMRRAEILALRVEVRFGKDTGKQGKVTQVVRARNWVVVEGLNTHYRYVGQSGAYRGTYIASEAPLLYRQVSLVDPTDRKPTEVDWQYTEEGERVRVSTRTGRIIPMPVLQRRDGIIPEQWKDGPKDTSVEDAMDKTYVPSLKTFQEEIMEKMGIIETRRFRKSYWY